MPQLAVLQQSVCMRRLSYVFVLLLFAFVKRVGCFVCASVQCRRWESRRYQQPTALQSGLSGGICAACCVDASALSGCLKLVVLSGLGC